MGEAQRAAAKTKEFVRETEVRFARTRISKGYSG